MSDVQSLLRDFPTRWKNINILKQDQFSSKLCLFMYLSLLLTTVYYGLLILWIIIGTMYQIHLTEETHMQSSPRSTTSGYIIGSYPYLTNILVWYSFVPGMV